MTAFQRRDLNLNDGTQVWLCKRTGIVDSVKDWSETYVSSSGGGGYLQEGTGHVSAPTVSSTSVHRQVFFLKYEDGTQEEFQTTLISVGAGHKVTTVWGAKQGKDKGHNLGLYNHTTKTYAFWGEKAYNCGDFGQRRVECLPFVAYMILLFVLFWVLMFQAAAAGAHTSARANWVFWAFVLSIPVFCVRYYRRRKHLTQFYKDLTSKALALMREA